MAPVALSFAVLDETNSAADLGIVLAARQIPQLIFILVGGVMSDRLPRNAVMVGANVLSGAAQLVAAALILGGAVEIWHLAVLGAVNGSAAAFFYPASSGIVPETVSVAHLQQANALLRLSLSATMIGGAALGGIAVSVVGSGWTLGFDGVTYLASAAVLLAMKLPPRKERAPSSLVADLREGWREFSTHTWLWVIVVAFGFINAAHIGARDVLTPVIAKNELGGPEAYGFIAAGMGVGLVLGGVLVLRWRPSRLLFVGCTACALEIPLIALLALGAPLPVLVLAAVAAGIGFEIFGVFWDLALQQNVPQEALSRVYSYDMLGSFVLIPVGLAVAGPAASAIGIDPTLWICAAITAACVIGMLAVRDVRTMRRREGPTGLPEPLADLS
jgi:predicted MFS family arabinose efflux permease